MRKMNWRFLFLVACAGLAACSVSRKVDVPPFIPPTADATLEELVARVNARQAISSLVLRVDLQFQTVRDEEAGESLQYRSAQGRLLLARPDLIRLNIQAPILSVSIVEMASNGDRFQLLIHPAEYRALIEGSNDRQYREQAHKLDEDPELQKAGPLVNIRPQHFTEAFLTEPIDLSRDVVFMLEEMMLEPDERPGAKEGQEVRKSYYTVTVGSQGEPSPRRRLWFDRNRGLELSRQQAYDSKGLLVGDARFARYLPPDATTGQRLPSEVLIERPYDRYTLRLTIEPDSIVINRELPETAFVLNAPDEWEKTLRRINLDVKSP